MSSSFESPVNGSDVELEDCDLVITPNTLKFGERSHQVPVDTLLTRELTLKNAQTSDIWVEIISHDDSKSCFKYSLTTDEIHSKPFMVKAGKEEKVEISLTVLCTTRLEIELFLKTWKDKESTYKRTKISFALESQLSLKLDPDELKKGGMIGEGSFGAVFKGQYRGRDVAIKVLKNQDLKTDEIISVFYKEVSVMEKLRHDAIAIIVGAVYFPGQLSVVTDFAPYGNLMRAMNDHPKEFTTDLKVKCLLDASCALNFLHQSNITHRDLKPDNLLVFCLEPRSLVCAKLSDFGLTRDVDLFQSFNQSKGTGTPLFMAPELILEQPYDKSVDVYSFALLMYVTFAGKYPFQDYSAFIIPQVIVEGKRPEIPSECPKELAELMVKCWCGDPFKRPSFEEVYKELLLFSRQQQEKKEKDRQQKRKRKEEKKKKKEEERNKKQQKEEGKTEGNVNPSMTLKSSCTETEVNQDKRNLCIYIGRQLHWCGRSKNND